MAQRASKSINKIKNQKKNKKREKNNQKFIFFQMKISFREINYLYN